MNTDETSHPLIKPMKPCHLQLITLGALSLVPSLHAAPLLPGKKIGVDFGPTLTPSWNNFTANGTKSAGTVIHLDGSISDGLEMTTANGQFYNNDGTNNWVGLQSNTTDIAPNPKAPPEFVDSVTTDIAGNFNLGDATPFQLTVNGLNPYLTYKVDAVSAATGAPIDTLTIVGLSTYGPSAITRANAVSGGLFHHFDGVVASESGQLVFGVMDSSASANPIMNGILVEVTGPTAAGLADNDGDSMPNWWEVAYQFDPESGSNGGSSDADEDGFSNVAEFNAGSDPWNALSTPAPTPVWAVDGDGTWSTAGNWNPAAIPNGANKLAKLSSAALVTAAEATLALNTPVALASLEMTGDKPFFVGPENVFTFNSTSTEASLSANSSNSSGLTFLGNVTLASPLTVFSGGQSTITIEGALSDGAAAHLITKTGTGDLVLSGSTTGFDGGFDVLQGRLVISKNADSSFPCFVSGTAALAFTGGGKVSLTEANSHSGGTVVLGGSTLELDNETPLGTGALTLNEGTFRVIGAINAPNRSLNVGEGGATVDVTSESFVAVTGSSAAGAGTLVKAGPGTWQIQGGATGTVGTFTVEAGVVDFLSNDRFGNHAASQQDLVIEAGAKVSNGTGAVGFNTFRNLALGGGTLAVTNSLTALSGAFQAYHIKGTVTVDGNVPSLISDEVNGANGAINIGGTADLGDGRGADLTFQVEDSSADANADLTISAKLKNSVNAGFGALRSGLAKSGPGTLALTRINSYTGDTTVNEGVLVLQQASLSDIADVVVENGATLRLEFTGTDTVDQLTLGVQGKAAGVYGATGSGAQFESSLITGTGTLTVTTTSVTDPFSAWMALNFASLVAPDNAAGADPDHDGFTNLEEFAFSGDPTSAANRGARRVALDDVSGTRHLTLTFACPTDASFVGTGPVQATVNDITYTVRGSTDLGTFTVGIGEIAAITSGLPEAAAGYRYRTFRITDPVATNPKAFLEVKAVDSTP